MSTKNTIDDMNAAAMMRGIVAKRVRTAVSDRKNDTVRINFGRSLLNEMDRKMGIAPTTKTRSKTDA